MNNWHTDSTQNLSISQLLELPLKNAIYKYFELPNHSSLLELLLKNVYKYFQLPNHSSLPELPFKSDVYQSSESQTTAVH